MFIEKLSIEGYKSFGVPFTVQFRKGLNVLVGENATGKSAIIDALRLLLLEDDSERKLLSDSDFFLPFAESGQRAGAFRIRAAFSGLSQDQEVAFLPWTEPGSGATLTLLVENRQSVKGRYKPTLWGGASRASMFERELFDAIECVYLPPLRDAEARLREGKSSRLARLLKNLNRQSLAEARRKDGFHPLETKVRKFNRSLSSDKDKHIAMANDLIRKRLLGAIGNRFGQDTQIKFTEANFSRIVESLRLFFFPEANSTVDVDTFRGLEENSLGYNNLLYIATVLAELTQSDSEMAVRALLIEEPEAHLHPQFQTRLLRYLETQVEQRDVQVIVTTHSPVLASAASLDALIHVSRRGVTNGYTYSAIRIEDCALSQHSRRFISRWLDVTKSTLLFARGVILVEGIAEGMLLPELARRVLKKYNQEQTNGASRLPKSLEDAGVSIINMNGIYFKHFMQLFCNLRSISGKNIPVRCSGITDNDPGNEIREGKKAAARPVTPVMGKNPALKLVGKVNKSKWARLYVNRLKTFEYDLAMEKGNMNVMIPVALSLLRSRGKKYRILKRYARVNWHVAPVDDKRAEAALYLLKTIDKGEFAQALADRIAEPRSTIAVPEYIRDAVVWACGGDPDGS
jgi:putative ATP-dependent endonuclease of OLD family